MRNIFLQILILPQMRKDFEKKLKMAAVGFKPEISVLLSTTLPLLYPALTGCCSQNCAYEKTQNIFFRVREKLIKKF